jgi:hypothetical protein
LDSNTIPLTRTNDFRKRKPRFNNRVLVGSIGLEHRLRRGYLPLNGDQQPSKIKLQCLWGTGVSAWWVILNLLRTTPFLKSGGNTVQNGYLFTNLRHKIGNRQGALVLPSLLHYER